MPTSLDQLLPPADVSVRCADHSRSIGVDPGGTAIRADRVVLVAVPLPWPKPALDHQILSPLRTLFASSVVTTRLLATVADEKNKPLAVTVYDRNEGAAIEYHYEADSTDSLVELATALAASAFDRAEPWLVAPAAPAAPAVLVCTQGSHDVCCGSEGVRFATEVEEHLDASVFRVSHTGGHRFAPTAMTLPDGRMWADLDLGILRAILAEAGSTAEVSERCRGWWGADVGPAQVAERAVFAELGWSLNHLARTVEVSDPDEHGIRRCTVTVDAVRYEVTVAAGRTVPSIACRQPGGLPAKEAREYEVRSISRT